MPRTSPRTILRLEVTARGDTAPYFEVIRAKLIVLAAGGLANEVIARRLDLPRQVVSSGERLPLSGSRPRAQP